jgi:hypothetical protein
MAPEWDAAFGQMSRATFLRAIAEMNLRQTRICRNHRTLTQPAGSDNVKNLAVFMRLAGIDAFNPPERRE